MKTSETGLALVRGFEGLRLAGYLDAVKIPTIGWGHTEMAGGVIRYEDGTTTTKVIVGKRISEAEAKRLKAQDMGQFERGVEKALTRKPSQYQFDAMVALAFNIGVGAFAKSSVCRKFNAGDIQGAANAFLMWTKAGGQVLKGLVRRREAERALFLGDIALASKHAGSVLPGYGSPLEDQALPDPAESGARPDANQGTPDGQSSTIISQYGSIATTASGAVAAVSGVDWRVILALGGIMIVGFAIWTITERRRHARESGL